MSSLNLGTYLGLAPGSAAYSADMASFVGDVGETPTYINEGIGYSAPMSDWVAAAQSSAGYLAESPGGTNNIGLFSLPMESTSDTTPELQQFQEIASGADDSVWTGIVEAFEAKGFKTLDLRPGWEMNGDWYSWSIYTEAQAQAYVAAFDHIANVARSVAGITVNMVWNPASTDNSAIPTQDMYPGDNYVDIIGLDLYDVVYPYSLYDWSTGKIDASLQQWWANPVNDEHYWSYPDATAAAPEGSGNEFGLVAALTFAAEHGKPFGLPETGDAGDGLTDGPLSNPAFPEYLAQMLLSAGAPSIAFVSIWDKYGTSAQFTEGANPAMQAAWADFVKKMNQDDAGPTAASRTITVAHGRVTNLLSALNGLITPGQTGDTETISHVSVTSGSVTLGSNGAILYTPGTGGTATITYTVTDQLGDSITASANITVDGGPAIKAAALKIGHNQTFSAATLAASLVTPGISGDTEILSHVTALHGTVTVAADGTITYTAPATGTDTLSYTVTDQLGDSITGSSKLTIDAGPSVTAGSKSMTAGQSFSNLTYYLDQQIAPGLVGDTETITAISATSGTVSLSATGNVSYVAPASGRDTLTYTVTDQLGDTATSTYTVTVNPATVSGRVLSYAPGAAAGTNDAGVTVALIGASGAVVATATTSSTGYYTFTGLLAGTYQVQYTPPSGQAIKPDSLANVATGLTAAFSVAAGQTVTAPQGSVISLTAAASNSVQIIGTEGLITAGQSIISGATGGAGAAGGSAAAPVTTALASATTPAVASARAVGGAGGLSPTGGQGGAGGTATASANATNTLGSATAGATAIGGAGGVATGTGGSGGAGGVASGTTATAHGLTAASASVSQTGGSGGLGGSGAGGGGGAASSLVNAVSGSTDGGNLVLSQTATGGAGGSGTAGTTGAGGSAVSQLTFNDTKNPQTSATVAATVVAAGGNGGTSGAAGGTGSASATVTAAAALQLQTTATGGTAGTTGGNATATSTAVGTQVRSVATATGGTGQTTAGTAAATAHATGTGGTVTANTQTALAGSHLVAGTAASATAAVNGASVAISQAGIGTAVASNTGDGAVAFIDGAPAASAATPLLTAHANTHAALGSSTAVLAIGEVGGAHSASGTDTQTSTASTDITLNVLNLATHPDLFLAFTQPTVTGSGITGVGLNVTDNGTSLISKSFATASAATSWFSDHPLDLGALTSSSAALDLHVALSVTTNQAGGSFDAQFVVGDAAANAHWSLT